ncbi:MAG: hypothetical protein J6A48_04785, partial [Clostridia bacterium]|nr:hypothetical protein [Clostridia bacterium]
MTIRRNNLLGLWLVVCLTMGLLTGCAAVAQQQETSIHEQAARRANVPEGLWILINIHQKTL